MEERPVSKSQVTLAEVMQPQHANPAGNIFGGVIMSLIDNAALICASRHTNKNCVTASIDRIDFISPVFIGNVVFAKASINYVATTSMEIGVRVEAECLITGNSAHVASAYLTFVALDEDDKPIEIPGLKLETEEQKRRYKEGKERRENRVKKIRNNDPHPPCMIRLNNK
ncbi:MAG: acyl-CoA thioesterase [Candidatus Lokiarchaeota archaeon]|nr:acyl-CoA thioesterase [Candidatus Lokiarchaeota archaeon]MBD3338090.1 acyl-CoA thioesterase [Candidatus Lokiarchaeota archaeon]